MTTSTDPIEVPYDSLNPDTLRAVVEEFITRNGTDYGEREKTLEQKVADVMRQLKRGEVVVVFDRATSTTHIIPARADRRLRGTPYDQYNGFSRRHPSPT